LATSRSVNHSWPFTAIVFSGLFVAMSTVLYSVLL